AVNASHAALQRLRTAGKTLGDALPYTMADTAGATSSATLTVTIHGANDAPVAVDDAASATEAGGVANGTAGVNPSGNVLTNDTDVDSAANGETKAVTAVSFGMTTGTAGSGVAGGCGTLTRDGGGSYTYDDNNAAGEGQAARGP